MQYSLSQIGRFATPHAQKYLTQLCKHFGHKVLADVQGDAGHVTFAVGKAFLKADDQVLTVTLNADSAAALGQLQDVVDDHLKRFAFREDFTAMNWDTLPA